MSDKSLIEWTDATWNPITGCSVVSPGCKHCYAMKLAGSRLRNHPTRAGLTQESKAGPVWTGEVRFNEKQLLEPLRWSRPRKIFVCAHGDLFAEGVADEWIDKVFAVMALCPQHVFQVLTKRPERMRAYFAETWQRAASPKQTILDVEIPAQPARTEDRWHQINGAIDGLTAHKLFDADRFWTADGKLIGRPQWPRRPLPNIWLGVSVENQHWAVQRICELLETPAAIRFISAEPLLGPLDLEPFLNPASKWSNGWHNNYPFDYPKAQLDWVICGGESGVGARPMHPDWARSLRDQCAAAGVAFFFKQWGVWTPGENVSRMEGVVDTAHWFDNRWSYGQENLAREGGHRDDEPDLYSVGKQAAGRLLDGCEHNGMPA